MNSGAVVANTNQNTLDVVVNARDEKTLRTRQRSRYRVAHLHSSEGVYGAERWTMSQVSHLADTEIDPLVVTMGNKTDSKLFHEELARSGMPAIHLPIGGKLNLRLVLKLRSLLVKEQIQVLHTHEFKSDVVGYLSTRGLPIALVSTAHGWCATESWLIRLYEAVGRVFLRRFDRIFPVSPALLEGLLSKGFPSKKVCLVLDAVDIVTFDALFTQRQWRRKNDPLNVLYVGRLTKPKGVMELIKGFSMAKLQTKAHLYIVGDGPEQSAMVDLSKELGIFETVHFLGVVDDVSQIYRTGDVLILPSYTEGLPRVIMEAFAAGIPVIGTNIPGIRQLIIPEESGFLVPTADPQAIARYLEKVEQNPESTRKMAINAKILVSERHSSLDHALIFAKEYMKLAG